jgi:RNA polymerase sigma factor (sigma-70 family)
MSYDAAASVPDLMADQTRAARFDPESTAVLLERVRAGDREALDTLFTRCLPPLRRWARGRLPAAARPMMDTQDLVQDTVLRVLKSLPRFESRGEGALLAYLRQAVANRIKDEARRQRPVAEGLVEEPPDLHAPTPLEKAIGRQGMEQYEAALRRLRPQDREAIVARIELQYSFQDVAGALGKPSEDAARMAVKRALEQLVAEMRRGS